jgi:hypothetical protein
MKLIAVVLSAILSSSIAASAAEKQRSYRADRILVAYLLPKDPAHQAVYTLMKERRVLERFKEFLSPLLLPRVLKLRFEGCDGVSNAWYEDDAVTICYEYLNDILRNAPEQTTAAGVTRIDAIVGPTLETVLHEIGHAVFDYLDIPLLGREEDAADQFAAYILLQFDKQSAQRLIAGTAYAYYREASLPSLKKNPFADEHGLPAQRFYNVLCMAYGSDTKTFAGLVSNGVLPKERAEYCEGEYEQVEHAMNKLIRPYIDRKRAERVRARRWLNFEDVK